MLPPKTNLLSTTAALLLLLAARPAGAADVTANLDDLGIPTQNQWPSGDARYARNVWDMQVVGDRIYFGSGNSASSGPAQNAGPARVRYFSTSAASFAEAYTTQEEQIDVYNVLDGVLHVPGHDPRPPDDWNLGNYYRLSGGTWSKFRNLPNGVHNYDMARFDGKYWAALGTSNSPNRTVASSTDGINWSTHLVPALDPVGGTASPADRTYNLFVMNGNLYASAKAYLYRQGTSLVSSTNFVYRWSNNSFINVSANFVPGAPTNLTNFQKKIIRDVNLGSAAVYIGAGETNDHQSKPFGLYVAQSETNIVQVPLGSGVVPYDTLTDGTRVWVLTGQKLATNSYKITVRQSTDLTNWTELFSFTAPSFARSFERHQGDFYFGLGTDVTNPTATSGFTFDGDPNVSGRIYRLRQQFYAPSEVILDNGQTGFESSSGWTNNTARPGYLGVDCLHDGNTGQGTKWAKWIPTLPAAGTYEVFLRWASDVNRATNALVAVEHAAGRTETTVNQQNNGGTWFSVGSYSFPGGGDPTKYVAVKNNLANGFVIADAVRWVAVAPVDIVMDNGSAGFSTQGTWTNTTARPGYWGADCLHDGNTGQGTKWAKWTPSLPSAGTYQVYARWASDINRATNAVIAVEHAGGRTEQTVNQQINGGQWVLLGSFNFAAGTNPAQYVIIKNDGANGFVIADAVRFLK